MKNSKLHEILKIIEGLIDNIQRLYHTIKNKKNKTLSNQ